MADKGSATFPVDEKELKVSIKKKQLEELNQKPGSQDIKEKVRAELKEAEGELKKYRRDKRARMKSKTKKKGG